jgi:hypothetical protein
MSHLTPRKTGRTRLKPLTIGMWWWKRTVLIHQTEFKGFVPEYCSGMVGGFTKCWWADTKPEWRMELDGAVPEDT